MAKTNVDVVVAAAKPGYKARPKRANVPKSKSRPEPEPYPEPEPVAKIWPRAKALNKAWPEFV